MIKFFRKIRQRLLTENKFSKYFFYAIGEIILVVLGILIALQVNNWNENRIAASREQELYQNLLTDLNYEDKLLQESLNDFKKTSDSYYYIFEETQGNAEHDTINQYYNNLRWPMTLNLLVSMKYSDQLSTISNIKIKDHFNERSIVENRLIDAYDNINNFKTDFVNPFLSEQGVYDTKAVYGVEKYKFYPITKIDLIRYDILKSLYGTTRFDQILFELRSKNSWVITNIERLLEKNNIIRLLLEQKLN